MMPAWLHKTAEAELIMKRSIFHPTHPVAAIAICVAGICTVASVNLQAKDSQVGRYSLLAATPTEPQSELLALIFGCVPLTFRADSCRCSVGPVLIWIFQGIQDACCFKFWWHGGIAV
jgi:hypothetical protein